MCSASVDQTAWEIAERALTKSVHFATAFTSCAKVLMNNAEDNQKNNTEGYNNNARFLVRRFLKCPSVLSPVYYATLTFHPEKLAGKEAITPEVLMSCYTPDAMAALLVTTYLNAHTRHKIDEKEWEILSETVQAYADLGLYFGYAIPEIGPAKALMYSVLRHFAFAVYAKNDLKGFQGYRRKLKNKGEPYDVEEELKTWGCAHYHIAALMTQKLCFGKDFASGFAFGFGKAPDPSYEAEILKWRITTDWIDSIVLKGEPPTEDMGDQLEIKEDQIAKLHDVIVDFVENGSKHDWLSKRKDDISPEKTPELFTKPKKTKKAIAADKEAEEKASVTVSDAEIDFDKLFPEEELKALTSEIKELLEE